MDKKTIISKISKKTDFTRLELTECIDLFFEQFTKEIEAGNKITIVNIGSFLPYETKAKTLYIPETRMGVSTSGRYVEIPAKMAVKFVPSSKLKVKKYNQ